MTHDNAKNNLHTEHTKTKAKHFIEMNINHLH
jgi:hypothetical protein